MARVRTIGFEAQAFGTTSERLTQNFDGHITGAVTSSAAVARLGIGRSIRCDSGAGNDVAKALLWADMFVQDRGGYLRAYFYFDALPSSNTTIMEALRFDDTPIVWAVLTTGGKLQLWCDNGGSPVQVGSDSAETVTTGAWHMVELHAKSNSDPDQCGMRLNGVEVAYSTVYDTGVNDIFFCNVGWCTEPGANKVCYVDDYAVNDDGGADENTWCGEGKIVLLLPTADVQAGVWTAGAGGTTSLYEAVNNTPPAGAATATNTSQIKTSDTSGSGSPYRCEMTTYAAAGITSVESIRVMHLLVDGAEGEAFGAKDGSAKLYSNPAATYPYDTFRFGYQSGSSAMGAWPAGWQANPAFPVDGKTQFYAPSVTLGTAPVVELARVDAFGSGTAHVDFIGIYVEFVPPTPTLYWVTYDSALAAPTGAQVRAGDDTNDDPADASGSEEAPTTTTEPFTFTTPITGLSGTGGFKTAVVWYSETLDEYSNVSVSGEWFLDGGGSLPTLTGIAAGSVTATGATLTITAS